MVNPKDKATYVREMFDAIVPRYDLMNRLMSGGRDMAWRRLAARLANLPAHGRALDVAAGTADLSLALARMYPDARVVALDFSLSMLERGAEKATAEPDGVRIRFTAGDGLRLPFSAASFDAVTSGFMMRNVADIDQAFAEMARVVRPGGRVVCLEFSQPRAPIFRDLFWWYFRTIVPRVGRLISRHAQAYAYLPASVEAFVSAEELKRKMEGAGLRDVTIRRLMGGTVALHVGVRP